MKSYLRQIPQPVWIQTIGHALTSFISIILLPFLTLYMYNHFGENIMLTTLVIGVQPFTEIIFTFLFGGWIDRFGRRPVMLSSLLFQFIALTGLAFADHLWLFVFFIFLNGVGRFVYTPAARAQISDIVPEKNQAETFALLNTASSIGALGGPVTGALLFQYDQKILFLSMGLLVLMYFLIGLKYIPETYPSTPVSSTCYKLDRRDYKMIGWLVIGMLPLSFFHAQMETNWPVFLKENLVHYLFIFSLLETIGTVVFILFEVVLVQRTRHFSQIRVIQTGYLLYGAASLGFGFSDHLSGFIVSQLIFCMGAILTLNHMQTIISTLAPSAHKGRYFALFGLHWDISRTGGPFLGSIVLSAFGGETLFFITFALIISGGLMQKRLLKSLLQTESHPFKSVL
ncbi:MFS transporter [Halobacillus sp. H74]|uniref:MFS transporter n=1 Tax=Halobacillus sp. H74 TaxID=3457436 RepID=UPI003FCCA7A1